jgi:diguanylate cyclase (GGDEF)-like protein
MVGPLLTLAIAGVLLLLGRTGVRVPIPGAFMVATVFLSSYMWGAPAGYVTAAVAVCCSWLLLTEPDLSFIPDLAARRQLVLLVGLTLPFLVSHLRGRAARRLARERTMRERAEAANRELLTLRTELMHYTQELERLATTDDLTGLCNRRHFLALAEAERRRHAQAHMPLALLILDIDLFKSVNDRFGHDAGDAVIRHVVDVCRSGMGASDILARLGGEEFVLLLLETTGEEAVARAERTRKRLETAPLVVEGTDVRVTISIGVSQADADTQSIGDLMKRADQALYRAKREGRNLVRYAAPRRADAPAAPAAVAA